MKRIFSASLAAFALASMPAIAHAQDPEPSTPAGVEVLPSRPTPAPSPAPGYYAPADEPASPKPVGPTRYDFVRIAAGARVGYMTSAGFDQFAKNDVLTQFSLEGTTTLLHSGRLSLAAGLAWDAGGRASGLRGIDTSLTTYRFTMPIEGRIHFAPWLYGFARVAPGANYEFARVEDPSSQSRLSDSAWAFAADASAGASFLLGPHNDRDKRLVRFWLTPEAGYSMTSQVAFSPNPGRDDKDVLGSDASMRLHPLALNGMFWRISAAVTF